MSSSSIAIINSNNSPIPSTKIQHKSSKAQLTDHHVSCEDLLDFAVDKPIAKWPNSKGKGYDSDEVRVMQKVLANEASYSLNYVKHLIRIINFQVQLSAHECMDILQCTQFDVHKAIKCIRLRETLKNHSIYLECNWVEMLSKFNWNIRQASNYLIATQGLPEDTTEV